MDQPAADDLTAEGATEGVGESTTTPVAVERAEAILDEAYARLHRTGPEFAGWLSNHGPMAVESLIHLGHPDGVLPWLDRYATRLEPLPSPRWRIEDREWRDLRGDTSRLGDWIPFFDRQLAESPWESVLETWWPRLIDGAIASATHGLIRTAYAVRALRRHPTQVRVDELAHSLGYWAARWALIPGYRRPSGKLRIELALERAGRIASVREQPGGIRAGLSRLGDHEEWASAVGACRPPAEASVVPELLNNVTDSALAHYLRYAAGRPVMLIHSVTAPRAAAMALPSLPEDQWLTTFDLAWACAAAVTALYSVGPGIEWNLPSPTVEQTIRRAVAHGDEHVLKLAEVAVESHLRGSAEALPAAVRAASLIRA